MAAKALRAVKPKPAAVTNRSYWSGNEAEEIIQRVAAGETLVEEAERLDVMIDPDTAMTWLRRNKINRRVSNTAVARYASDMTAGFWPYTHQGIAFDRHGYLLDGQHRLHAIVQSGCTIAMQVTVNMDPTARKAIDQGKSRSTADVATIEAHRPIEAIMAACAAKMHNSVEAQAFRGTRSEQVDFIMFHLQAIIFAVEQLPSRCLRIAYGATRAVVARAYYSADRQTLERFCEILRDGGYGPGEEVVFMFREYCMRKGCKSTSDALQVYCVMEWCLQRFIDKAKKPEKVRATEKELFPIPQPNKPQPT